MPSGGPQPVPSGSRPHGHHQPSQHRPKRRRRNHSEVSCCLKYVIFGFNVIFWLIGLSILAIGVWAWTEKDTFNNLSLLTNVALDPAFIFIWAGAITFVIGFTGCVGALRENTALLAAYAIFLAILLLLEMTAGILGFIFKDWIKDQATSGFQAFIVHYRDDPDQQNLIDWIQEGWLQCCGMKGPMIGTKTSISIAHQPLLVRVRPVVYPFHVANPKWTNSLKTYNVAMTFVDKIT